MDSKGKTLSRIGMIAKGVVYSLIGILTALSAFGYGGKESGSRGALSYLAEQTYGQIMLIVLGLGLLAYVFYRMFQAFGNHNAFDDGAKGLAKRAAYFISGLIYGGLAYFAFKLAFSAGSNGQSSSSGTEYPDAVILLVGAGMLVKAVYDIYRAYSQKFREDIKETEMSAKERKLLLNSGRAGHTSRGIVLALMAYMTLQSGLSSGSKIGKQTDAFEFIKNEFGTIVLGIVAIGLVGYAVYMFIKAKYPSTEFRS